MEYISVKEWAELHGVSERTARNYCAQGKIDGAFLVGKTWNVPVEAGVPKRKSKKNSSPLLSALREQKEGRVKGGIYHRVQIDLTYNSNHMEGTIHPFQDGNGRVGRLIMFRELLRFGYVPFIITDDLKMYCYNGLRNWPNIKGYPA